LLLYGSAAALIIALHLATDGVLGFHIDELYYLASGRHPPSVCRLPTRGPLLADWRRGSWGHPLDLRLLPDC